MPESLICLDEDCIPIQKISNHSNKWNRMISIHSRDVNEEPDTSQNLSVDRQIFFSTKSQPIPSPQEMMPQKLINISSSDPRARLSSPCLQNLEETSQKNPIVQQITHQCQYFLQRSYNHRVSICLVCSMNPEQCLENACNFLCIKAKNSQNSHVIISQDKKSFQTKLINGEQYDLYEVLNQIIDQKKIKPKKQRLAPPIRVPPRRQDTSYTCNCNVGGCDWETCGCKISKRGCLESCHCTKSLCRFLKKQVQADNMLQQMSSGSNQSSVNSHTSFIPVRFKSDRLFFNLLHN